MTAENRELALLHFRNLGAHFSMREVGGIVLGIQLRGRNVSDADLALLNAFRDELDIIGLEGTAITDRGLLYLSDLLKLDNVDLTNTTITDAGLRILSGISTLQYVHLDGTRVTAQGVAMLQEALPNCEIVWYGCNRLRDLSFTGKPIIRYLNTDLDLVAPISLKDLAAALESLGVFPLHVSHGEDGQYYATLETEVTHTDPDTNIAEMLTAIDALPQGVKHAWNACTKREFDVGYDCGDEPWAFNQGLTNQTLRRMADCGCTFRITLYPYREQGTSNV
ncbi:MAG: hypothetical protein K8T91_19700 [Planctomycetes bacterium]|nr:hypothetical protein [Planctomycetota bacterium]